MNNQQAIIDTYEAVRIIASAAALSQFQASQAKSQAATQTKAGGGAKGVEGSGNVRDKLLNSAQNDKLKNAINEIYRPGATTGDGGLADAVRHEISTGELV